MDGIIIYIAFENLKSFSFRKAGTLQKDFSETLPGQRSLFGFEV